MDLQQTMQSLQDLKYISAIYLEAGSGSLQAPQVQGPQNQHSGQSKECLIDGKFRILEGTCQRTSSISFLIELVLSFHQRRSSLRCMHQEQAEIGLVPFQGPRTYYHSWHRVSSV